MDAHPIQLRVEPTAQMERSHVVIRLVLLVALGAIGCSSAYWVLYLVLPAFAALRISQLGPQYLANDAPRLARALTWLAEAYAYVWLLTDALPSTDPRAVMLEVTPTGAPTVSSALLRLLTSLPAMLVLGVVSIAAGLLWPIGALLILLRRRLPRGFFDFFLLTLRWQFRLVGYHLSLVDQYPSFSDDLAMHDISQPRPI